MEILDRICYICIDILRYWEDYTGIPYGVINTVLFVIIQPILILFFAATTLICNKINNLKLKRNINYLTIFILSCCIVGTALLVSIPLLKQ